jgi:hypothetical protein
MRPRDAGVVVKAKGGGEEGQACGGGHGAEVPLGGGIGLVSGCLEQGSNGRLVVGHAVCGLGAQHAREGADADRVASGQDGSTARSACTHNAHRNPHNTQTEHG